VVLVASVLAFTVLLSPRYYRFGFNYGPSPPTITPHNFGFTQIDTPLLTTETEKIETQIVPITVTVTATLTEEPQTSTTSLEEPLVSALPVQLEPWDSSFFVNGPPTASARGLPPFYLKREHVIDVLPTSLR
jgi:hypothetical protein